MNKQEKEASEKVMQLLTASWINQPLYVVSKLEIPDILSDSPKTAEELSEITKSYSPFLYRIMRALAAVGFFYEDENGAFSITPLGEILQKDKMQPIALMFLSEWHNLAWQKLLHSVQNGEVAFDSAFGKSCFDWFKENPEEAEVFNEANRIKAVTSHTEITKVYEFSHLNSIVDIGGGYGGLLFFILNAFPKNMGCIADLPYMKGQVERKIEANDLRGRCEFYECNFFDSIPKDFDCYILSNILHDWGDDECEKILDNCHDAMPANGILLIIESIIPGRNVFSIAKLLDIEVLVMGGGKERTEAEYRDLLKKSNFELNKIINTNGSFSVIECIKQ